MDRRTKILFAGMMLGALISMLLLDEIEHLRGEHIPTLVRGALLSFGTLCVYLPWYKVTNRWGNKKKR
jgi:hypothetical protein